MAVETTNTTTQFEDSSTHQSRKSKHMSKISSLPQGHIYALNYFPAELQVLLNIASLKFHEWSPGHFVSILGWPKESRQSSQPHSALLQHLEIHWGEKDRTVLFAHRFSQSDAGVESQPMIADTEQVLLRLRRGVEFAPPFSAVLTVVDDEHLTMLSVFFRYCLLLQGHDTAKEGFQYDFWFWFEKLCRHVAKQTLPTVPLEDTDGNAATSTSATAETKLDSSCCPVDTEEHAHEDKTVVVEIAEEEEHASNQYSREELAKMREEVEAWKMAYEEQNKKVGEEKSWLCELHLAYVNAEAKLKERQREAEE